MSNYDVMMATKVEVAFSPLTCLADLQSVVLVGLYPGAKYNRGCTQVALDNALACGACDCTLSRKYSSDCCNICLIRRSVAV